MTVVTASTTIFTISIKILIMSDNSLNVAQSSGAASVDMQTTTEINPLLEAWSGPHATPAFDRFRNEDYMPAFQQTLKEARAEVEAIVTNPDEPTFANTIEALEFSGRRLDDLCNLFFNLNEACTDDEMQRIA